MTNKTDLLVTAIAPIIWGSTYLITTEYLPAGYPLTVAMLRALPVGLLLLLVVRQLPSGIWWLKILVLGALNFSIFWWMLFVAAYRLPGGVAATVGAIQPLLVIILARQLLGKPIDFRLYFAYGRQPLFQSGIPESPRLWRSRADGCPMSPPRAAVRHPFRTRLMRVGRFECARGTCRAMGPGPMSPGRIGESAGFRAVGTGRCGRSSRLVPAPPR